MEQGEDTYRTLGAPTESVYKDRGSRFLAYAYPIRSEGEIKEHVGALRKRYYDATHHCYAWRLGPAGDNFRAVDDGEPSSTAGRPILGQLLSRELTDALVVVVRYFGGTKLGVPGLIAAYRTAASDVLDAAEIVTRTVDKRFSVEFAYEALNDVMRVTKEMQPTVEEQHFDNLCRMTLSIRCSRAEELGRRLREVDSLREVDNAD